MFIEQILRFASIWSVVVPLLLGLFYFGKLSFDLKLVTILVALSTISQFTDVFLPKDDSLKNFVYNIYTPLEFLFLNFLFKKYMEGKIDKRIFVVSSISYIFISILFIYVYGLTAQFLKEWVCVNNLIYTTWILIIFYKQYSLANVIQFNFSTPVFWIFIGLLFYAPVASLYFSVYDYAQQPNLNGLKSLHHIVNTSMYICFAVGIYKDSLLKYSKILNNKRT